MGQISISFSKVVNNLLSFLSYYECLPFVMGSALIYFIVGPKHFVINLYGCIKSIISKSENNKRTFLDSPSHLSGYLRRERHRYQYCHSQDVVLLHLRSL